MLGVTQPAVIYKHRILTRLLAAALAVLLVWLWIPIVLATVICPLCLRCTHRNRCVVRNIARHRVFLFSLLSVVGPLHVDGLLATVGVI